MRNAWNWARERWRITVPVAAVLAGVGIWLFFGFFGFHTLFFDETVDEPPPTFTAGPAPSGIEGDATSAEMADAMTDAMAETETPSEVRAEEAMPDMAGEVEPTITRMGSFIDRSHPTSGIAEIIEGGGQRFLRLEDFATDNGPDLNVYLSTAAPDAPAGDFDEDFVDLGDLKGNIGSQNYEIPPEVELDRYRSVVIWCVRFAVVFGAAELSP